MHKYGELPFSLGKFDLDCPEMMFYQYLPIKFPDTTEPIFETRLDCLKRVIGTICCDYVAEFGLTRYVKSYIYLTAKKMYQMPGCSFNRAGWHSDGYTTPDINYIISDAHPTIFNNSHFILTPDDKISLEEMTAQVNPQYDVSWSNNTLLRLNQYNIHKVNDKPYVGMRTFVKVSFSYDRYDLKGNSHNYLLNYEWDMRERGVDRNVPQNLAVADLTT